MISVEYPEPINSLQRLTVRWFDTNGTLLNFRGYSNHAFILKLHVLENDVRRLPPPPPLQDVEIKRIVEAMTMVPPPPPEKRKRIPWVFIFLALIGAFIAWKTLAQRAVTA
jgi:cytochrome c1